MEKKRSSVYVTLEADRLMNELSRRHGLSRNAIIELAIRTLAEKEGIPVRPVHVAGQEDE